MNSPTFNTIAAILEQDFRVPAARLQPDVALTELGLDALSQLELVLAVEDAFRLRFPSAFLDPRDGTITLHRLCELVEKSG